MARTATGIDIGLRTAKVLRGRVKGNTFVVTDFVLEPNPSGTIAGGWEALGLDFKPTASRVGLTGREVNVRYTRVPRVPDWQLRKLMRFETDEIAGQSESGVASDFNVLPEIPEIEGEDVVLLAMARETLLDEHYDGLMSYGGKLDAFTPNAIALYNAWLHYGVLMEDTVLVANVGHENLDVVLARGSDLLFARNLTGGSKLFDDALIERFGVSAAKAEQIKREMATLDTTRDFDDANEEKASRALLGPAGQLQSLLQSSVMFCKSQVKLTNLKLDRVMLCGGGAALDGLASYLKSAMNVPVELFDPFQVVDTSELDPEIADLLEDNRLESVVALGLAHSASDPEAYAIEILPARVHRRRQLVEGTAFLIAAAVLAVLFLGLYAWKNHGVLDGLRSAVASLNSRLQRVTGTHHETEGLLEQNRALAEYADDLYAIAGSGEQVARALALLEASLPQDFWIEKLTSTWRFDEEMGIGRGEERPILHVEGRTLEGTEQPTIQFEELVTAIEAGLPGARVVPRMGSTGGNYSIDLCILAPPSADALPEGGD